MSIKLKMDAAFQLVQKRNIVTVHLYFSLQRTGAVAVGITSGRNKQQFCVQ